MGCTQSSDRPPPSMGGRKGIGHTERIGSKRRAQARKGIGQTERLPRHSPPQSRGGDAEDEGVGEKKAPPMLDENGHLMPEEVQDRMTRSERVKEVVLGDPEISKQEDLVKVQYAFLTQRGYYPDDVHKENQDAYSISTGTFGGKKGDALFAVYDGHGRTGNDCAIFAKKKFPKIMEKCIKGERARLNAKKIKELGGAKVKGAFHPQNWPMLTIKQYEAACKKAHLECNAAMHKDLLVDDALSGTTVISAAFHGGRMTICNVGDSRAVLGYRQSGRNKVSSQAEEEKEEIEPIPESESRISTEDDQVDVAVDSSTDDEKKEDGEPVECDEAEEEKLLALPMSRDQTPFRKDERERIKKAGGRVMSIDQMEGLEPLHENWGDMVLGEDIDEEGDPPRIWCQNADYPGTAFTRSLGDTVAEAIGVNAIPEIVTRHLCKRDEILVVASDGVFEFLTNQAVIDICSKCDTPLEACEKVVAASYERWLHYELRTDDITIIVMFISCNNEEEDIENTKVLRDMLKKEGKKPFRKGGSMTQFTALEEDKVLEETAQNEAQ